MERFLIKRPLWESRTGATEAPVLRTMELPAVRQLYLHGTRHPDAFCPDGWTIDCALMQRRGNRAIQLELQANYARNLEQYSKWQAWLREHLPPTLVLWGRNDPVFGPKGAEAFKRDVHEAEIHLLDTGHFALEEDLITIVSLLRAFLERNRIPS